MSTKSFFSLARAYGGFREGNTLYFPTREAKASFLKAVAKLGSLR